MMKHVAVLSLLSISLIACTDEVVESKSTMSFEIPAIFTQVDNSNPITVNGNEIQLSGDKLIVWDVLTDIALDKRADFFDTVWTGSINDYSGYKLIETVPSLDTPVCTLQTQQLEFAAGEFEDVTFIVISNDTPFALQRFCAANKIENLQVMSDARTREFGKQNSLYMEDYGLLTRSIMIVDENNVIQYIEYADEVTSELDLLNALAFLKDITTQ